MTKVGRTPNPPKDNDWKIAETAMPDIPPNLSGDAAAEWRRISPYMLALDRIAKADRQALAVYCIQWANFCRIMRELSDTKERMAVMGRNCEVCNPLLSPLLQTSKSIIKIAGQFGMTARTRDLESDHGNRKSTALKRLMGNQRKVAEHNLREKVLPLLPEWSEAEMRPPTWMNEYARQEYKELGDSLSAMDLFTPLDVVPVTIAACLFDLFARSIDELQQTDMRTEVTDKDGEVVAEKEHPLWAGAQGIVDVLQGVWKDYGQTPRFRKVFNSERKIEKTEVPLVFRGRFA